MKAVGIRKWRPERRKTALEAARGPHSVHSTQEETKIEPGDVDQQPLTLLCLPIAIVGFLSAMERDYPP